MKIAIIPARGGSKRIPLKNIRSFRGKPVLSWSIDAARQSGLFDHIIVSTDSAEISATAREYGAETPFMRDPALADDRTGIIPVVAHATAWAEQQGWHLEGVCCVCATAPFLRADDLIRGWEMLRAGGWDYVFSVTAFTAPVFRSFTERPEGGLQMLFPEHFNSRSQDLPETLHDAAHFYWGTPEAWKAQRVIFSERAAPVVIPRYRTQDIDTEEDWLRTELMHEALTRYEDEQRKAKTAGPDNAAGT